MQGCLLMIVTMRKSVLMSALILMTAASFLSALLISLGAYAGESVIRVEGTHGMAYIDMTVRMMEQFGIKVQSENGVYKIASRAVIRQRSMI